MVMPGGGSRASTSRRTEEDYHTALELQSRQAGPSTAVGTEASATLQLGRIQGLLRQYFPGGGEGNFDELIQNRASILATQMHQTDRDVQDVIKNARELDNMTANLEGAANALGYALCAVPGTLIGEALSDGLGLEQGSKARGFVDGVAVGMTALTFKGFLEKMMENSLDDIKWMQANPRRLEPEVMALAGERDTGKHKAIETSLGGTGFNARNFVTGGLAAGLKALPENAPGQQPSTLLGKTLTTGNVVNQTVGGALTLGAGTVSNRTQKAVSKLYGEAYLFGRTDWRECYELLASTTPKQRMREGGKARTGTFMADLRKKERWLASMRNVLMVNNLAEMAALGIGLGIANVGQIAVRDGVLAYALSHQFSGPEDLLNKAAFRVLQEAGAQVTNLPLAALAYLGQGFAGLLSRSLTGTERNWRLPQPEEEESSVTDVSDDEGSEVAETQPQRTPRQIAPAGSDHVESSESEAEESAQTQPQRTPGQIAPAGSDHVESSESEAEESAQTQPQRTPGQIAPAETEHVESAESDASESAESETAEPATERPGITRPGQSDFAARTVAFAAPRGSEQARSQSSSSASDQPAQPGGRVNMNLFSGSEGSSDVLWWLSTLERQHRESTASAGAAQSESAGAAVEISQQEMDDRMQRVQEFIDGVVAESESSDTTSGITGNEGGSEASSRVANRPQRAAAQYAVGRPGSSASSATIRNQDRVEARSVSAATSDADNEDGWFTGPRGAATTVNTTLRQRPVRPARQDIDSDSADADNERSSDS